MKQFKILQITNILLAFALPSLLFTNTAHSQDIFSSQFTPGPGVKNKGGYVTLKGPDPNFIALSWVEYSRPDSEPVHVFVEARKEITGDGKDPVLKLNSSELTVTSASWQVYSFGMHSGESIKIFFTNDQWIKNILDVNVSIRKLMLEKTVAVDTLYSDSVTVSWDANTEPDLAGYQIRYGNVPRQYTQTIDVKNATKKELNLERGKMYYLVVSAYDSVRNYSNFSGEVTFYIASDESNEKPNICDINGDGKVSSRDWFIFNRAMNTKKGDAFYNARADFNNDGVIDQEDRKLAEASCKSAWLNSSSK